MQDGLNFFSSNYHMTWSAFALILACRTEFAFNIGHFLIILPSHSLLATFQVSISLNWFNIFGWNRSKVVWGSKLMNTFMHGPSFFSFHFFSFSISVSKLTIFTNLHPYVACKMWKITGSLERWSPQRTVWKTTRVQQEVWALKWNARARAQLLNMLYISTHLSIPHGENIWKTVLYI